MLVIKPKEKMIMDGQRLRILRKQKRLTQEQLGKILHVSKVSISGYESGDRTPDTENLQKIADYFEVSVDYLLGRTDNPNPPDEDEGSERDRMIHKLATEFPEADLMFEDLANMTAEELEEVYEFIKFKKSQGEK